MEKEVKHTALGKKLVNRLESVRDFYHGKDEGKVRVRSMSKVEFVAHKSYTAKQIKEIREAAGLTQQALAELLATSVDAVRKWEQSASVPNGPALRLLQMLERDGIPESLIAHQA